MSEREGAPVTAELDRRRALTLGALATLLYLVTAPAVVNADGLGYLKLLPHNFAAGHLLYMPILRAVTRLFGDGLRAGRLLNAVLGGSGVVLFYGLVRRALQALPLGRPYSAEDVRFASTFAAAGLAVSYGYWVQGSDVEAYALATVALLATVRLLYAYQSRPTFARAAAVGLLLGVSVLCHLSHVLLTPLVAAFLLVHAPSKRVGRAHALLAVGIGGALAIDLYAYAAFAVRLEDFHQAIAWIATAAHGFHYQGGSYRLAEAVYGLAKSVVWSPYLYESNAPVLLGQFLLGLVPLVALGALLWSRRGALPPLPWRMGLLWIAPYALLAIVFFGSDTERWLFILPALWLAAAALTALLPGRRRLIVAAATLAWIGGFNFATGIWPAHRENDVRWRIDALSLHLKDGDLVIFPGHSWDEYVSFYATAKVEPFPIVYYAARDGLAACWARLDKEAALARARGGRIFAVRVWGEDPDTRGWSELSSLGLGRQQVQEHLAQEFQVVPVAKSHAVTVVRLDTRAGP